MDNSESVAAAEKMAESFEGFRSDPYQDSVGVWTIGFGSTRDGHGDPVSAATPPVTQAEARVLAIRDLGAALEAVKREVKVELSDDEAAALIDFVYNLGAGNLESSTLLRKLNAGDFQGAADQFACWDRAGGQVLAGLLRRRIAERDLFEAGFKVTDSGDLTA